MAKPLARLGGGRGGVGGRVGGWGGGASGPGGRWQQKLGGSIDLLGELG